MELNIYNKEGRLKATVSPADSSTLTEGLMTDYILSLSFVLFDCVQLDVNDYVDFLGKRYWMLEAYIPNQKTTIEWNYNTKFYGIESVIRRALCLKTVDNEMNAVFSLTAPAIEHVRLVVGNINRVMGTTDWKVGEVEATANLTIDYNATYCDAALASIATAADTEYWIDGLTVNLCRCEHGELLSLGYENGLKEITLDTNENAKFFTRLFPLGSTRNIDASKYGSGRLHLPGGVKYVEQNTHYGIIEHSEEAAFSAIYPRRVGKVGVVRHETKKGEDGKEFDIYYFTDPGIDFDPNKYEIGGLIKSIVFETGDLAGRDFEVNYNAEKKEFEVITQWPYGDDMQLPGALVMKPGNDYILYNITLPTEYYPKAEAEFSEAVAAYMEKNKRDKSVYKAPTDYIDLNERGIVLTVGQRVHLVSDKYFPAVGYRDSRITKITRKVNETLQADIEISDLANPGGKAVLTQGISEAKHYAQVAMAGLPDMIKSWENTPASDSNLYTSKKTDKEIRNRAISRQHNDSTDGHITFNNGLLVKSPLNVRQLKTVMSDALTEEGDDNSDVIGFSLIEEGDGNPDMMSSSLIEEAAAGAGGASTLGELDNVDESFDTVPDDIYSLRKKNGIYYPVKGGGGSVPSKMSLAFISSATPVVAYGHDCAIQYSFSSTMDGEPTGPGTATYTLNNKLIASANVNPGTVSFNPGRKLSLGDNTLVVQVTDSYGNTRKLTYTLNAVSISISSTFDDTRAYTGPVAFVYTPVGAIEKVVHFKLEGREIGTVTTSVSNRQQTYSIPRQAHGAHSLEVYMTATIEETSIESDHLYYDIICIATGNNTPVIASSFRASDAGQFSTLVLPYMVYNPSSTTSSVTLSANGSVVSEQMVNRTRQTWSYRTEKAGPLALTISCGSVSKTFSLTVRQSEIDVQPEEADLVLFLTSVNRSNNEGGRGVWSYGEIYALLTAFNWATNGWIKTVEGFVGLRVSGDARVSIPYKAFANDFRATGKTLEFEFETRDVSDYDAVVLSCMNGGVGLEVTAQKAVFRSQQTTVETQFKENERARVSFVVEKKAENRLIYVYVNGEMCGVVQYPEQDNFTQNIPAGITIGNNECTSDIFNIRVYDNNLNRYQLLDNYIADMDNLDLKRTTYARNRIYDDYGNVSYDKLLDYVPVLTIIGNLPAFKGDKVTCMMKYEDRQHPERSWMCLVVQNDVQGTSSQYFPRKNYKFKFKALLDMILDGTTAEKFSIREGEIPVTCFCVKADFAESSGCHNTGMARMIDFILRGLDQLTPPQKVDPRVRTTIDGYPIVIFHQATEDAPVTFLGKYNFNNDKSTQETFGFTTGCECWEVLNNTSDRVLFKSSDYTTLDADGNPDWLNDFEARYPDDDDLNDEYKAGKMPANLKRLTDWLVSVKGDFAKFKAEASQYLDLPAILSYYTLTEFFAMVDQRAKNMFLTTYDGIHWQIIFYDNDTCLGINNEGVNAFDYTVEYHDKIGTQDVWNGEQSTLWNNIEQAYQTEIAAMYASMRGGGWLRYDVCDRFLNIDQCDRWSEAVYNEDGYFKYVRPLLDQGNGSYLYAGQGSRKMHRIWWLNNRFKYMDSKYVAGDFKNDFATMRLYTPTAWTGVKPNADITVTSSSGQYVNVKYGSYMVGARTRKNVPYKVTAPGIQFNDTETIIYGASQVSSLGDLSALYAGTIDVSRMSKLVELLIGSGVAGYKNYNLTVLSVGANDLLRKLDVRGCPNLRQAIDLSLCAGIGEVWAEGSGAAAVVLPVGGNLSLLHLPETITNLTVRNQPRLTDAGLVLAGVENLSAIRWENTNGANVLSVIERCLALGTVKLDRVRLIGVDWFMSTLDTLNTLSGLKGMDENGNNATNAIVTGKLHVTDAAEHLYSRMTAFFPELVITYDNFLQTPTRTIKVIGDDTSQPIAGATVVVNDVSYTTDSKGEISVKTQERLEVSVSYNGYKVTTKSYSESTTNRTYTISLLKIVIVSIITKDQFNIVLKGATVIVDGKEKQTNDNGIAEFSLAKGSYPYKAVYDTQERAGTVTVNQSDVSVSITFNRAIEDYRPIPNGNVQLLLKGGTAELTINSTNTDYMIHWGDGSSSIATGTGSVRYSHTYALNQFYNVEVSDCNDVVYCNSGSSYLYAYWSIGGSLIEDLSFKSFVNLACIGGDLFSNDVNRRTFSDLFRDCDDLTSIPSGLFDNCTAVTSFADCFYSCRALTSIPSGLFDNCPAATSFNRCFSYCNALISIPSGLFDNCTAVTSFNDCFSSCSSLISIPSGLFDNCTAVTSFADCFFGCDALISIPSGLFDNCTAVTSFNRCFSSCDALTSIPSGLFDNCTAVTDFINCFSYCDALTSIPSGLFDNCTAVTDFGICFYYCSSLISIPSGLFDNCTAVTNFYGCFSRCSKIPAFISKLTMVSNDMFYSCSSLTLLQINNTTVVPMTNIGALTSTNSSLQIKVPANLVASYKAATNWINYASKIVAI